MRERVKVFNGCRARFAWWKCFRVCCIIKHMQLFHCTLHLKVVTMISFIWCIFYYKRIRNNWKNKHKRKELQEGRLTPQHTPRSKATAQGPGAAQGDVWRGGLENQAAPTRQLQDALTNVEKHFGEQCQIFAAYVQKTARLWGKADLLANEINCMPLQRPHIWSRTWKTLLKSLPNLSIIDKQKLKDLKLKWLNSLKHMEWL